MWPGETSLGGIPSEVRDVIGTSKKIVAIEALVRLLIPPGLRREMVAEGVLPETAVSQP